jgi:hypothetical protein
MDFTSLLCFQSKEINQIKFEPPGPALSAQVRRSRGPEYRVRTCEVRDTGSELARSGVPGPSCRVRDPGSEARSGVPGPSYRIRARGREKRNRD